MSIVLYNIDPEGEAISMATASSLKAGAAYAKYFKNTDLHNMGGSPYRGAATNIYRTKDEAFSPPWQYEF